MRALAGLAVLPLLQAGAGCGGQDAAPPAPPPPAVTVAAPVEEEIVEYREFTGRTVAVASVEIRARVTGYLQEVHFREGDEVEAGELLYTIDPRPYQAALDEVQGRVAAAEAELARLQADLDRSRRLLESGVTSQEDFDRTMSEVAATTGTLQAERAAVERARLDLEFASVRAPIDGLTSLSPLDPGSLVVADTTVLTSVVGVDPIQAEFDVDERSMLVYRERIAAKEVKSARDAEIPVWLGLSTEEGFPHEGVIDFVDNRVDATSGTLRVRGTFPNPTRALAPGLFVRVRVPFSEQRRALLVDERALGADQKGWYVWVVGDDGTAEYRSVEPGESRAGRVVVEEGLVAGERVIVIGQQRARPGAKVRAEEAGAAPAGTPSTGQ